MNPCGLCGANIRRALSIGFIFSYQAEEEAAACAACLKQFEPLEKHTLCPGCSRPQETERLCQDCLKWSDRYRAFAPNHQAIFAYNEMARAFMNRFKFQGDVVLGQVFKEVLAEKLHSFKQTHTIVPVPMSQRAEETRGFNQVEVLLRAANISYEQRLIHIGQEAKQSSKTREERLQTKLPFAFAAQAEEREASEKPFLIVDDVYTTGRTLYYARELLETIGQTETLSLFR